MSAELFPVVSAQRYEDRHQPYLFLSRERAEEWARLAQEANDENDDGDDRFFYVAKPLRPVPDDEPIYTHAAEVNTAHFESGDAHAFRVAIPASDKDAAAERREQPIGAYYRAYGLSAEDALERLRALMTQHGETQLP